MNTRSVVISQSMYFPWVGMLEQIRLADVYVHYDDVQFSKGSFTNRVQIKQLDGSTEWMTVPLAHARLGQRILDVAIVSQDQWVDGHLDMLRRSFASAPHAQAALEVAQAVLTRPYRTIAELARASMLAVASYYGLDRDTRFVDSAALNVAGKGSQRVVDIVKALDGTRYITGHGALKYLDHELFEREKIEVSYMSYDCKPYPQSHHEFTPYVSSLDLIAHLGRDGIDWITSNATFWKNLKI